MTYRDAILQVDHASEYGRWTLYRCRPSARLTPYAVELQGYAEEGGAPVLRKELPSGIIPLILVFGPGFVLHDIRDSSVTRPLDRSFVAGLHENYALVGSEGRALCMQVNFTPWGARRFLGVDMHELTGQVIGLNAIAGAFADRLEERLYEAPDWPARFTLLDELLWQRIDHAPEESMLVRKAWNAIRKSGGNVRVGDLARGLGISRKHLAALFVRETGLPPKSVARVLRFQRAFEGLQAGGYGSLAELASFCGYADQAHFNRDFAAFAGESPSQLRAKTLQDGTGIMF